MQSLLLCLPFFLYFLNLPISSAQTIDFDVDRTASSSPYKSWSFDRLYSGTSTPEITVFDVGKYDPLSDNIYRAAVQLRRLMANLARSASQGDESMDLQASMMDAAQEIKERLCVDVDGRVEHELVCGDRIENTIWTAGLNMFFSQRLRRRIRNIVVHPETLLSDDYRDVIREIRSLSLEEALHINDIFFEDPETRLDLSMLPSQIKASFQTFVRSYFVNLPIAHKLAMLESYLSLPPNSTPVDIFLTILHHTGPMLQKLFGQMFGDNAPPLLRSKLQAFKSAVQPMKPSEYREALGRIQHDPAFAPVAGGVHFVDPTPIGAATIGEGHIVVMEDGPRYFLKMQRLGLAEYFEYEREVNEAALASADALSLKGMWDEIVKSMMEELDFLHEAEQLTVARLEYAKDTEKYRIRVPKVIAASSTWILMELAPGAALCSLRPGLGMSLPFLPHPNKVVAPADVCSVQAALYGWFQKWMQSALLKGSSLIHLDPHDGNAIIDRESDVLTLWVFDATMGSIDAAVKEALVRFTVGLLTDSTEVIMQAVLALPTSNALSNAEIGRLYAKVDAAMESIRVKQQLSNEPLSVKRLTTQMGLLMQEITASVDTALLPGAVLFGRALVLMLNALQNFDTKFGVMATAAGCPPQRPTSLMINAGLKDLSLSSLGLAMSGVRSYTTGRWLAKRR